MQASPDGPLTHFTSPRGEKGRLMNWLLLWVLAVSSAVAQAQNLPLSERHEKGMAHLKQAAVYSQAQRDHEALVELEKAYDLLPPSYGLSKLLGEAYLKTNNARAVEVLSQAVELNPVPEAWENLAKALAANRRFDKAIETFSEKANAEPKNTLFRLLLGEAYWSRSRFQDALQQFHLAVELSSGSARAHFRTGYAQQLLGDSDAAKQSLERALKLDPDHALANLSMGHLLADEGKGEDAIPFLERFSEKKPDDVEVRLKLAQVFLDLQRFDNVLAQLETAEQLAPENKRVYYLFARLYKSTGRTETAKQALARFNQLETVELEEKRLQKAPYITPR